MGWVAGVVFPGAWRTRSTLFPGLYFWRRGQGGGVLLGEGEFCSAGDFSPLRPQSRIPRVIRPGSMSFRFIAQGYSWSARGSELQEWGQVCGACIYLSSCSLARGERVHLLPTFGHSSFSVTPRERAQCVLLRGKCSERGNARRNKQDPPVSSEWKKKIDKGGGDRSICQCRASALSRSGVFFWPTIR